MILLLLNLVILHGNMNIKNTNLCGKKNCRREKKIKKKKNLKL